MPDNQHDYLYTKKLNVRDLFLAIVLFISVYNQPFALSLKSDELFRFRLTSVAVVWMKSTNTDGFFSFLFFFEDSFLGLCSNDTSQK